uniref:hypothetical protein n=1 Tax=Jeotgalibaca porci TaxID=1868793 RepID=UPI00359F598D
MKKKQSKTRKAHTVKFGIKAKLIAIIIPTIATAVVTILFLTFNSSEKIIIDYGMKMVASESATSASKVETWAQGILSYLEEARNTLKTVSFDEESEMAYLKTSLNRNES